MLILIVFILIMIGSALTFNIYSIFRPFIQTLSNIQHYNVAYYWAISSIERAELVLRYHTAWFEGSWGWEASNDFWPSSDKKIANFWLLSKAQNWMWWEIKSRITSNGSTTVYLPKPWKWNVDYELRRTGTDYWWSSSWFNKLDYNMAEEFLLYRDDTTDTGEFYTGVDEINKIVDINPDSIQVLLRLPPKIGTKFNGGGASNIDDLADGLDLDGDWISDDIIVNRSLFWIDNDSPQNEFTILPTIDVDYDNNPYSVKAWDTAIRESIINNFTNWNPNICFGNNSSCRSIGWDKNPVQNESKPDYHNIIPDDSPFSWHSFKYIFSNWHKLHLKFSIVNLMKTSEWKIYPFLEYKLIFNFDSPTEISDRFFHIKWIWKVWDYKVIINLNKPVVKSSAESDFTILF